MLSDLWGAVLRRWYVLLVGVAATAGLGVVAGTLSTPDYTARGLVLLLPPASATAEGGNPFLVMSGLDLPASIVVAYFQSETAQEEVAATAPTARYVVSLDDSTRGPVIAIDVRDKSAKGAIATLNHIAAEIPTTLAQLQSQVDAPKNETVSSMPLTMDTRAEVDGSTALRLRIAAIGVGLFATAMLTSAIDGLLLRRRSGAGALEAAAGERRLKPAPDAPQDDERRREPRQGPRSSAPRKSPRSRERAMDDAADEAADEAVDTEDAVSLPARRRGR